MFVRIIVWIARIAGVAALLLGLTYWITRINLINFHMLSGLTLTLSFLILSITALFIRGLRLLGMVGFLYALVVPVFGMTQATLLIGSWHWLIQVAHLLVGLGALTLVQRIYDRYNQLKLVPAHFSSRTINRPGNL